MDLGRSKIVICGDNEGPDQLSSRSALCFRICKTRFFLGCGSFNNESILLNFVKKKSYDGQNGISLNILAKWQT